MTDGRSSGWFAAGGRTGIMPRSWLRSEGLPDGGDVVVLDVAGRCPDLDVPGTEHATGADEGADPHFPRGGSGAGVPRRAC